MLSTYLLSFFSVERAKFIWKVFLMKKYIFVRRKYLHIDEFCSFQIYSLKKNLFTWGENSVYYAWNIFRFTFGAQFPLHFFSRIMNNTIEPTATVNLLMFIKGCLFSTIIPFLSTTSQLWKYRPIRMSFLLNFNVIFEIFYIHFGKANISWRIFEFNR